MIYRQNQLENFFFIEVATASEYPSFEELRNAKPDLAKEWEKKASKLAQSYPSIQSDDINDVTYADKAALFPEFAKIVAIGVGLILNNAEGKSYNHVKVYTYDNEISLLKDLENTITAVEEKKSANAKLVGFNLKKFDLPFLTKRCLIKGLPVFDKINFVGKKPWEVAVEDIMETWQSGNYEYVSLNLVAAALGLSVSKEYSMEESSKIYHETDVVDRKEVLEKMVGASIETQMNIVRKLTM